MNCTVITLPRDSPLLAWLRSWLAVAFVDLDWKYHGLQVVRLENEFVSIDVLPELGAKIYNFVHRPSNRNLL
jgi:hypothetical protein